MMVAELAPGERSAKRFYHCVVSGLPHGYDPCTTCVGHITKLYRRAFCARYDFFLAGAPTFFVLPRYQRQARAKSACSPIPRDGVAASSQRWAPNVWLKWRHSRGVPLTRLDGVQLRSPCLPMRVCTPDATTFGCALQLFFGGTV